MEKKDLEFLGSVLAEFYTGPTSTGATYKSLYEAEKFRADQLEEELTDLREMYTRASDNLVALVFGGPSYPSVFAH